MRLLLLLALAVSTSPASLAQQAPAPPDEGGPVARSYHLEGGAWRVIETPALPMDMERPAAPGAAVRGEDLPYLEPEYTWRTVEDPGPYPELNLRPIGQPLYAGDVNGDGRDDYVYAGVVRDERTDDPSDNTGKTLLYFGQPLDLQELPDQVVYEELTPVGDFTGDGYDDALALDGETAELYEGGPAGFTLAGTVPAGLDVPVTLGFADLDGDGYEDAVRYAPRNFIPPGMDEYSFTVIWGAATAGGAEARVYALPEASSLAMGTGDTDGDGEPELVVLEDSGAAEYQYRLRILAFAGDREPVEEADQNAGPPQTAFAPSANAVTVHLGDVDGDGDADLMLNSEFSGYSTFFLRQTALGVFGPAAEWEVVTKFYPIGDLSGDGTLDYVLQDDSEEGLRIAFGPLAFAGTGETEITPAETEPRPEPPTYEGAESYSIRAPSPSRYPGFGDPNGDGVDEYLLATYAYGKRYDLLAFGRMFVDGEGGDLSVAGVYNDAADFPTAAVLFTADVGDVNADGAEDFAFGYYVPFADPRVEVYLGGDAFSEEAALVLRPATPGPRNNGYVTTAVGGDFDGDGTSDIAVAFAGEDNGIRIYLGGPDVGDEPDHEIRYADVEPGEATFLGVSVLTNAGDLNGDGADDLAFSVPFGAFGGARQKAFVVYGGPDLSATPDLTSTSAGSRTSGRAPPAASSARTSTGTASATSPYRAALAATRTARGVGSTSSLGPPAGSPLAPASSSTPTCPRRAPISGWTSRQRWTRATSMGTAGPTSRPRSTSTWTTSPRTSWGPTAPFRSSSAAPTSTPSRTPSSACRQTSSGWITAASCARRRANSRGYPTSTATAPTSSCSAPTGLTTSTPTGPTATPSSSRGARRSGSRWPCWRGRTGASRSARGRPSPTPKTTPPSATTTATGSSKRFSHSSGTTTTAPSPAASTPSSWTRTSSCPGSRGQRLPRRSPLRPCIRTRRRVRRRSGSRCPRSRPSGSSSTTCSAARSPCSWTGTGRQAGTRRCSTGVGSLPGST